MSCFKPLVVLFVPLVVTAFSSAKPQDEKLALSRAFKPGSKLVYQATHAETYVVDGDAAASMKFNGDATLEIAAVAAAEAGSASLTPVYTGATTNWWQGNAKEPVASWAVTGPLKVEWKDAKTRLTKERVLDCPGGFPNTHAADWFDAKAAVVHKLATALSAGDGSWATQTRLNFVFPPLAADGVAKGGRFDADYIAGYLGQEAQVQVFYANVVESWNDKTAVLKQSGRAQLVKFEKPTSRRADGLVFDVDSEKSTFSATVEVSRADGAVVKREGELTVVFKVTDPAQQAAAPKSITAKIWTKLERK